MTERHQPIPSPVETPAVVKKPRGAYESVLDDIEKLHQLAQMDTERGNLTRANQWKNSADTLGRELRKLRDLTQRINNTGHNE